VRTGPRLRNLLRSGIIVGIITLVLRELFGLFIFRNFYSTTEHRYSFIGEDNVRSLPNGLWTYEPNKKIWAVAVYGFGLGRPWIEYDCTWETNRFGLVKTAEKDDDTVVDLLVLGDSLTEGQGGCPWFTQETLSNVDLAVMNGGLQGAGIRQFQLLEQYITQSVRVKDIAVLAIADDFFRQAGNKWIDSERRCLKSFLCGTENILWAIKDDQWANLIPLTEKRIEQTYSLKRGIRAYVRWHFLSGYLADVLRNKAYEVLDLWVPPMKPSIEDIKRAENYAEDYTVDSNVAALIELKHKYPHMRLILIPQREEVGFLRRKSWLTSRVEKRLKEAEISYEWCDLNAGDYMYIDVHPNQKGGKKLFNCLLGDKKRYARH